MTLREVLHAHIPSLTLSSTVRDAVDKMDIYQFSALVVVDSMKAPIGIVTEGDICRAASSAGSLATIGSEPAARFGTTDPETASPDLEIADAYHRMLASGLTILPIVDQQVLAGVVFRVDLMHAMLMDGAPGEVA